MSTFAIGDVHGHERALVDLLEQLQPNIETPDAVVFLGDYHHIPGALCVHAGIDPRHGPVESQSTSLRWGSYRFEDDYRGPELILDRHYGNAIKEHSIGVDTIKHGVLTAVQVPRRRVFQSARYDATTTEA